jgi:zinc transport system substrate-binding protein
MKRFVPALVTTALAVTALAGCGSDDGGGGAGTGGDGPTVLASFYPLQYATQRIAGDRAEVTGLTPPGAEPHDLELGPKDVGKIADADVVVYLKGFQPSVDEAVTNEGADAAVDVSTAAELDLTAADHGHEEEEHAEEEGGEHAEEEGGRDPHFWLDPTRLAAVSTEIADRLAAADPDGAATYRANADALRGELTALDTEFRTGLATCGSKEIVTSHQAFGYLARRYGLTQVGIAGLSPDAEPAPADLARVTDFVREHQVRTIYYETLVSPAVAETVAKETGARTAVLDPLEGLTSESAGDDYPSVMRANLEQLREGQACT